MLMKVSIMVIEYITSRGKEVVGVVPATVLGQDGQFVLVRHGSSCFRVHPCQLIKTCKRELSVINENETSERIPEANRDGNLRVPNLKYKQANSNGST